MCADHQARPPAYYCFGRSSLTTWRDPRSGVVFGVCGAAVECVWIGPLISDYDCSSCILGYERTSSNDSTCIKPGFSVHKHWAGSVEKAQLKLQDSSGTAMLSDPETNAATLLTAHTYKTPVPQLEPKHRMFAGYKQPHSKIHYELDFSLGAEVHRLRHLPSALPKMWRKFIFTCSPGTGYT